MKPISIFNTLTRSIEEFRPLNPPVVTYYSCGPTVYLPQHLGNLRAYIFVDTLKRVLRFNGYDVRHVINITDVGHMTSDEDAGEDKIEKTARAQGRSPAEIAKYYTDQFKRDCARLNIELPPDEESIKDAIVSPASILCRATNHVPDMIALIARIIANGLGYVAPSGVYFDVAKWRGPSGAGRLARQSLGEQDAGQRIEHSADKKSPHDFALWVLNQPHHLMQWDSPWGRGYPGWHIECSAMSMRYLGETIDIHTGGLDHIPVHHENEIAQSEGATRRPFVRYFVHNAFLVGMEGAKISKSAGKFPLVDDLVAAGINPLAFRLMCFGAKYRSELAFSLDAVRAAETNLSYIYEFVRNLSEEATARPDMQWAASYEDRFTEALNHDLNTSQALAVVLEMLKNAYSTGEKSVWNTLRRFDAVLGLQLDEVWESRSGRAEPQVRELSRLREEARKAKDFARSDELRRAIEALGYQVKDTKEGQVITARRL